MASTPVMHMAVAQAATTAAQPATAPHDSIGDTPFPALIALARANALLIAIGATLIAAVAIVAFALGRRRRGPRDPDED